jgi:hypothetical protein
MLRLGALLCAVPVISGPMVTACASSVSSEPRERRFDQRRLDAPARASACSSTREREIGAPMLSHVLAKPPICADRHRVARAADYRQLPAI